MFGNGLLLRGAAGKTKGCMAFCVLVRYPCPKATEMAGEIRITLIFFLQALLLCHVAILLPSLPLLVGNPV